jgi:hypothetical protein
MQSAWAPRVSVSARPSVRDLPEARASLAQFIEKVYNQKRLHVGLALAHSYVDVTE